MEKQRIEGNLEDKYLIIIEYLKERERLNNVDVSFAMFVEKKFPEIWKKYISN